MQSSLPFLPLSEPPVRTAALSPGKDSGREETGYMELQQKIPVPR